MDDLSVNLIARWRAGDQKAAAVLFQRYADRLIALVRSQLSDRMGRRLDPEDVVHSAYRSFFVGSRDGRYDLQRGGDLWHLLVTIALHKLQNQVHHHTAGRRAVARECSFDTEDSLLAPYAQRLAQEPTPLEAVALADELEQILRPLEPLHRRMLELRLQGYHLEEIAAELKCSERTVRRALERVKGQLEKRYGENPG